MTVKGLQFIKLDLPCAMVNNDEDLCKALLSLKLIQKKEVVVSVDFSNKHLYVNYDNLSNKGKGMLVKLVSFMRCVNLDITIIAHNRNISPTLANYFAKDRIVE